MRKFFVSLIICIICIFSQSRLCARTVIAHPDQKYFLEKDTRDKFLPVQDENLRSTFLLLCDSIVNRINEVKTGNDYFIDSYAVRALCVAYDMTGKQEYLDACISWSGRMVEYQNKMIPAGAYYMHYERKPGEEKGDWFVADGSCIAMGVLTTAVRCQEAEKNHLLQSVQAFASLVMGNYLGAAGGVCNGGWSQFKGEWWCSSGLFGSLLFMLYETTGNQKYLDTAMRNINWLNKEDLTKAKPFPIEEQGPSMAMYFMEAYSAGWPFVIKDEKVKNDAVKKVGWCLEWIKTQQQVPIQSRKWKPTEWWGSKFGGLPFYQFIFSKYLPEQVDIKSVGDRELKQLTEIVMSKKLFTAQLTMFMMLSYAERLNPGDLYRMKIKR
jgi:hypothetical protein